MRSFAKGSPDADFRCRCQIVVALVQGSSASAIRGVLSCGESKIYRVAHRFIESAEAGLADRREENGQAKVTEHYERWVVKLVASTPRRFGHRRPTWTQELLVLVMKAKTGIKISRSTMCRLLKRLKIRLGRPKPTVGCPWPKERKELRLKRLRHLINHAHLDDVWVYADEVDIDLNPKIGPDYMLRGVQKQIRTPGVNQKNYLAGALNAHTGRLTWVEGDSKDSELFIRLVFQLGRVYPNARRIHLILDNYSIHKSQLTKLVLASCDGRVRVHFLPPYCPDDNKIERVWEDLHANVTRNHTCENMNALMIEVRAWLNQRTRTLQRQYAKRNAA
jgi:transposase